MLRGRPVQPKSIPAPLGFVRDVFDLMDDLGSMTCHDLIRSKILKVTGCEGVTMFTVARLPQPRLRIASYTLLTSWSAEWLTHYDARGFYRHDPIVTACLSAVRPVVWSNVTATPLSNVERRVMDDAREIGMADGMSVPIVDINGFQAVVSMSGQLFAPGPDGLKALHLLSLVAYETAERLAGVPGRASARLSPREQDVLQYAAAGLGQQDIADRLGISIQTAITHAKSARHKLGAANTTHAVVKALREGKIRL